MVRVGVTYCYGACGGNVLLSLPLTYK